MPGTKKDVTLTLTVSQKLEEVVVWVDADKVKFTDGEAVVKGLESGVHTMAYIFRGTPGTVVDFAIASPAEAKWARKLTLSSQGIYVDARKFYINKT